jgi:DNA-binding transcriptional MerR regulator
VDEISKKDLLVETGISYGQLYRWKREGLIPEEWFIRRSAYTGQETYFPREQMLARIQAILGMKDSHSLEQIRETLNAGGQLRFSSEVLMAMTAISPEALAQLKAAQGAELSLEQWALVAGIYDGCIIAGLDLAATVALADVASDQALSANAATTATADTPFTATATTTAAADVPVVADLPGAQPTNPASAAVRLSPAQVSIVVCDDHHHFVTSSTAAVLWGDGTLQIKATQQLQPYVERAQAALFSPDLPG